MLSDLYRHHIVELYCCRRSCTNEMSILGRCLGQNSGTRTMMVMHPSMLVIKKADCPFPIDLTQYAFTPA